MRQVHGVRVLHLRAEHAAADAPVEEADACITTEPKLACTVQVADCLPVLFAVEDGRGVGAAHAGWRGLAGGVLEATVSALCRETGCEPAQIHAWLGACIGPDAFETGEDVLQAFNAKPDSDANAADRHPHFRPGVKAGKWFADLPALARQKLAAAGLRQISGGGWCTVHDSSRFFSFRRDGVTGRMAAAIWRRG
jgi:YfiH family protein